MNEFWTNVSIVVSIMVVGIGAIAFIGPHPTKFHQGDKVKFKGFYKACTGTVVDKVTRAEVYIVCPVGRSPGYTFVDDDEMELAE